LKDRVKLLTQNEVLILRGDRAESLVYKGENLNEFFVKQHLTCLVIPHINFPKQTTSSYLQRYLAVYILFKASGQLYTQKDDVIKAFYM
jgi:hypothetical protein